MTNPPSPHPYSLNSYTNTGKDATEAFEDVGHSDEARALLPDMLVGNFEQGGVCHRFLNSTTATHTTFRTFPKLLLNLLRKRQHRLLSKDQSRCPTITTFALLVLISLLQFDVFPSSLPPWSLLCLQILLWSLKPFLLR